MDTERRAVLIILDGWGLRAEKAWNAIALAKTPNYSRLLKSCPNGCLEASGLPVGLPAGVMGNSEVGHMNIGAGRRVMQDQVRIHEAIDDGSFFSNPVLRAEVERTKNAGTNLHLLGLISQGNVHTAERHYLALVDLVHRAGFPMDRLFVHALLDGRDTPPRSAREYLKTLEDHLKDRGGRVASVAGRFFTMDRDKRWERVDQGYRCLVLGEGEKAANAQDAVKKAYARGEDDEFVTPTVITNAAGAPLAPMRSGDGVICFNFRPDRMREIVRALSNREAPVPSLRPDLKVSLVTFTRYEKAFDFPVAFPPQNISTCLGKVISDGGGCQFRTAETEKYAHVTYFLNGGREVPFDCEERLMIPSPKVKTYDLQPAMSSKEVTAAVLARIRFQKDRLLVVNFAQPDMVGHTGVFDAAVAAVEAADWSVGEVVTAGLDQGFMVFLTADHGNIEMMKDPVTGEPFTAHTTNPVPFVAIGPQFKNFKVRSGGALCDVAPTVLGALGIPKPADMTGTDLLVRG